MENEINIKCCHKKVRITLSVDLQTGLDNRTLNRTLRTPIGPWMHTSYQDTNMLLN